MTDKTQLRERWMSPAGRLAVNQIENVLRDGAEPSLLEEALAGVPFTQEVAPALDLRGIEIPTLISARKRDLSGARFDAAKINWSFSGSVLRGANFDNAEGRNVDFGGCDLTGSSFVKARLPGAIFYGARLTDANLDGIQMRGGQLKDAFCERAKFPGADLRLVWAANTNLRAADLSGANLVGASLGGAKWDESTRFPGARLSPEGMPTELKSFAISQGATLVSDKREWQLSLLDATTRALENEYGKKVAPIVERIKSLRPKLERDPAFLWANVLRNELDEAQWRIVENAVRKAASNIGALSDD